MLSRSVHSKVQGLIFSQICRSHASGIYTHSEKNTSGQSHAEQTKSEWDSVISPIYYGRESNPKVFPEFAEQRNQGTKKVNPHQGSQSRRNDFLSLKTRHKKKQAKHSSADSNRSWNKEKIASPQSTLFSLLQAFVLSYFHFTHNKTSGGNETARRCRYRSDVKRKADGTRS